MKERQSKSCKWMIMNTIKAIMIIMEMKGGRKKKRWERKMRKLTSHHQQRGGRR